jgi:pyruvate dehydrogenase E1 component beta subunit
MFDYLDAPIMRIGALNAPVPFARNLENYMIPNDVDIIKTVKAVL